MEGDGGEDLVEVGKEGRREGGRSWREGSMSSGFDERQEPRKGKMFVQLKVKTSPDL